jgi:hypothetical protein
MHLFKGIEMERKVQVYHHLGLGDHIICNGLIREFCKTHDTVYCFVKNHNMKSVSFMYRDEPKIELVGVEDDLEVPSKIRRNIAIIKVGFENLNASAVNFDESFYKQVGFEFRLRWDNFFVERDYPKECELLQKLNPDNVPFVFVHDDPSRAFCVDLSLLRKDLKLVRTSDYSAKGTLAEQFQQYTLFHWILVLQKAEEIHCMDSSFKCLVESLLHFEHAKLFFHRYAKGSREVCSTRKHWTVIKTPSLSFMARNAIDRFHRKIVKNLSSEVNRFSFRAHQR